MHQQRDFIMDRFLYSERRDACAARATAEMPALSLMDAEPEGYNPYDHVPFPLQPGDEEEAR